ncbi:SDR family oxidoreductase [Lactococcus insecticola]|uniref:Oxidoreductase n=1 Tax=Pseudolactococcus insecticola TaxID=2709158 RepID=A0A6A0B5S5_9LACT|nr:SDR family NAD(P)-dependent oxidoreductase [Lactococcus insecticola]GFH39891.1 oxidoreductase [Lactococcus insecticola]
MKLTNNTILITGGTSGIGLAFAQKFLALDNTVIVTGRSQAKIDAAIFENPGLHGIAADVSDLASVRALVKTLNEKFPQLNMVINSAGIMRVKQLFDESVTAEDLTSEIETNLNGTIWVDKLLLPVLAKQPEAMIINVTSGLANISWHMTPTYSATKSGVRLFTNALRYQAKKQAPNLHVVELVPPLVRGTALESNQGNQTQGITTEQLVAAGLKGIAKNKKRINVGQSKLLQVMGRTLPMAFENLMAKTIEKAEEN